MSEYIIDREYYKIIYIEDGLNFKEFENCIFNECDFSSCIFLSLTFIDCTFNNCNFSNTKINYVAFRSVTFNQCKIIDVNFAMCDKLIFEIYFESCQLDFSKFYSLKMKGTIFKNCSLIAVDFMNSDLTKVVFDNCNLYRSEFENAMALYTNFRTSYNYVINPEKTKIKKAVFSLEGVKGLLNQYDIIVK